MISPRLIKKHNCRQHLRVVSTPKPQVEVEVGAEALVEVEDKKSWNLNDEFERTHNKYLEFVPWSL